MNDYLEERDSLVPAVRTFVDREIASEQQRTHATISRLKERV